MGDALPSSPPGVARGGLPPLQSSGGAQLAALPPLTPAAPPSSQLAPPQALAPPQSAMQPAEPPAAEAPAAPSASGLPVPVWRMFEVTKVELLKLSNINVVTSTFKGQLWLQFTVRGGALDTDFNHPSDKSVFPMDPVTSKPTFRPSVKWYLAQLEFNNQVDNPKLLDTLVRADGDDLQCTLRWEGVFFEHYELHDFPFDMQALTFSLSINCRTTGLMPAEFAIGERTNTAVIEDGCILDDIWFLKTRKLLLRTHLVGSDADRLFPSLSVSAVIQRNPHYYVYNAVIPFALFSLLCNRQTLSILRPHARSHPCCPPCLLTLRSPDRHRAWQPSCSSCCSSSCASTKLPRTRAPRPMEGTWRARAILAQRASPSSLATSTIALRSPPSPPHISPDLHL